MKYCNPNTFMAYNGYKTSSKLIKEIITKEGLDVFDLVRIKNFTTAQDACIYESRFLSKVNAMNNPLFYNQSNGGRNFRLKFHTTESKIKISTFRKHFTYTTEMRNNISKGKQGKKLSAETKERMSAVRLGKQHDDATKEKISNALKGKTKTPEHVENLRKAMTGHATSNITREKRRINMIGRKWWNNSVQTKFCIDRPGDDWVIGRL